MKLRFLTEDDLLDTCENVVDIIRANIYPERGSITFELDNAVQTVFRECDSIAVDTVLERYGLELEYGVGTACFVQMFRDAWYSRKYGEVI